MDPNEKTLVFCDQDACPGRARPDPTRSRRAINPNYCQRVTANDGELGEQTSARFGTTRRPSDHPDHSRLSTGVDVATSATSCSCPGSMIERLGRSSAAPRPLRAAIDHFTIYDFVKASSLLTPGSERAGRFTSGDGMAVEPTEPKPKPSKPLRGRPNCEPDDYDGPSVRRSQEGRKLLADGKARTIQQHDGTTFGRPDGTPMRRNSSWSTCSASCPSSSTTRDELRRDLECARHAEEAARPGGEGLRPRAVGRDEAGSSTPSRATCSTCWPRVAFLESARDASGASGWARAHRPESGVKQSAGVPRLRAAALRDGRSGGVDSEKDAAVGLGTAT